MNLKAGTGVLLTIVVVCPLYTVQGQEVTEAAKREAAMDKALRSDDAVSVSGEQLRAFEIAYAKFKQRHDVNAAQKSLKKYTIQMGEDAQNYYIYFVPEFAPYKRDKSGKMIYTLHGKNPDGIGITYFVSKNSSRIYYELLNH